jgi:hypothetical protein
MQERIPYREIYWNIPEDAGQIFLYLLVIFATIIMTVGIMRDIARWRSGRPDMRLGELPTRTRELLVQIFGQQRVLRQSWPGLMHLLIFAGFLALFIGTDIIAVEEDFTIPLMGPAAGQILVGNFYQVYEVVLDTLGLVFIGGLGWAWWRRYRHHPDRLDNRDTDAWVLGVLLFLGVGGFLLEGLRLANQTMGAAEIPVYTQAWARLSYVGFGLATVFRSIGLGDGSPVGLVLHQLLWLRMHWQPLHLSPRCPSASSSISSTRRSIRSSINQNRTAHSIPSPTSRLRLSRRSLGWVWQPWPICIGNGGWIWMPACAAVAVRQYARPMPAAQTSRRSG